MSITPTQQDAIENFLESWGISQPYFDLGGHLNCGEANALAELLRAFGRDDEANQLLDGHATDGDNDDNPDHVKRRDDYFARGETAAA